MSSYPDDYDFEVPSSNQPRREAHFSASNRGAKQNNQRGGNHASRGRGSSRPPKQHRPHNSGSSPRSSSPSSSKSKKPRVEHEARKAQPTGLLTYQIPQWFPVFCSNRGLDMLCEVYFNTMMGRDSRMAAMITLDQFRYVTCLSFIYRVLVVNRDHGIPGPFTEASVLRDAVKGIQLPAILGKYIEALGVVQLPHGLKIGPFFTNQLYVDSPLVVTPQSILQDAGRVVPPDFWHIDHNWIQEWNQNTTRISRRSFGFGPIDYTLLEGRPEICVTRSLIQDPVVHFLTIALTPVQLTEEEAKLGACYFWRDEADRQLWPGLFSSVLHGSFRTQDFCPEEHFERLATAGVVEF